MSLNILFVASEMTPFIKTGGLGDVVGALPKSLIKEGCTVKAVIPLYSAIDYHKYHLYKVMDGNCVEMGNCHEFFCVHRSDYIPGIETYFIEFNKYFDRNGIYDDKWNHVAFQDNAYRYAFFCRAALQVARDLKFKPDVVHIHDWQTSLIPYYIKHEHDPFFAHTKTLLTIHNLPYQGRFGSDVVPYAKIDWCDFNPSAFEDYGGINFLKGGLRFADKLNTVSPNYAREILTPEFGAGLDFLLRERQKDLSGILNGIDTQLWNPSKDLIIPEQYSIDNVLAGKQKNKEELVRRTGLSSVSQPIFGMAVRLAEQKGIKMLSECIEPVLNTMQAQFVIMGQGDSWAQDYFSSLPYKYPGRISVKIGFEPDMEHLMDAGSDFSLVPSIYEPCGLKQMVSQTYGALPIARATGGLDDTVSNYNEYYGVGTGFKFQDVSATALYNTIGWANATYFDRPTHIRFMRHLAMRQNYSWSKSSLAYKQLYLTMSGGN
ncbi:MAG: glycogen synthase [Alphaproteobacteria bacterium]|nr:glycogen synthase [Alphaproteobacteria bacterium]